jgi:hypothetical protein
MFGIWRALPQKSVHDFKGFDTAAERIQHKIENLAHEAGFDDVQSKVLALHSEKSWNEELFQSAMKDQAMRKLNLKNFSLNFL